MSMLADRRRDEQASTHLATLEAVLRTLRRVVVGFSGGADSALVAKAATNLLGRDSVTCVTAVSDSLDPDERRDARALAAEWGLTHVEVETDEFDDAGYIANGPDRCAHCKEALMDALVPIAHHSTAIVVLGVNVDDLGDHRPGQLVAKAAGARFPLVEAGLGKNDVRSLSAYLGLRTATKPQMACLSSRIPYGTPVSLPALKSIATAERALRALGFDEVRVRHHGEVARVEIPESQLLAFVAERERAIRAVKEAGYTFVSLDLEGFTSGSMNKMLEREGGR